MKRKFIIFITVFALAMLSCNMLVTLPIGSPQLIPTETFSVNEPAPDGAAITGVALTLAHSNGSVMLAGGADGLASGEIQYNVAAWKPAVAITGDTLRIEQILPENNISSPPKDAINVWDLSLGDTLTNISITLSAGNYQLTFADTLPDEANIYVSAGVGNLRLEFPTSVTANVEVEHGPADIATQGTWIKNRQTYTFGDSGPIWTVKVDIGVGNLTLVSQ